MRDILLLLWDICHDPGCTTCSCVTVKKKYKRKKKWGIDRCAQEIFFSSPGFFHCTVLRLRESAFSLVHFRLILFHWEKKMKTVDTKWKYEEHSTAESKRWVTRLCPLLYVVVYICFCHIVSFEDKPKYVHQLCFEVGKVKGKIFLWRWFRNICSVCRKYGCVHAKFFCGGDNSGWRVGNSPEGPDKNIQDGGAYQ